MSHERNWETGEGFTNGLTARDIEYLIGVVTDTDYAAYRRGREDAANAIVRVSRWQYPERADNRLVLDADEAVAAARGVGEHT